ncbi:hypothetical protein TNCV_3886351 [Trichonephila clavipes]|nr:hypothetical protein TNCV_3886351 [Trichonephila clavipes]
MHYFIIRAREQETTPLRVKEDIEDVSSELGTFLSWRRGSLRKEFYEIRTPKEHYEDLRDINVVEEKLPEPETGCTSPFYPNFELEHPGRGQRPTTSLSLPSTSREELRLDGYTEYPIPQRHYTFINIYAFSEIRTQALRYRRHCH